MGSIFRTESEQQQEALQDRLGTPPDSTDESARRMNRPCLNFLTSLTQALEPELLTERFLDGLLKNYELTAVCLDRIEDHAGNRVFGHVMGLENGQFEFERTTAHYLQALDVPVAAVIEELLKGEALHYTRDANFVSLFPCKDHNQETMVVALVGMDIPDSSFTLVPDYLKIFSNLFRTLDVGQRDKLTGLLNRQTFDAKLSRMLSAQRTVAEIDRSNIAERRSQAVDCSAWLAIIDIDHFKRVNDEFGHVYGDEVILNVAQHIRACFRKTDLLFRFGGEEFVVVLEPTPVANVGVALERLRERVLQQQFQSVGHVTVSIGYAEYKQDGFAPRIIDYADQALYFAKENGRNQVANYESLVKQGLLSEAQRSEGDIDLF